MSRLFSIMTVAEVVPSSGAIKRARLEKTDTQITYEAFVEDLDRGDSFTTSLIEILVKVCGRTRTSLVFRTDGAT